MTIQPEGENIRRAVKWLGAERQADPSIPVHKLIDQACLKFNLSPNEASYLERLARGELSDA